MNIIHFGNTANNAFHNLRLLEADGLPSELPIRTFGLIHAISAPAWEVADFVVPNAQWLNAPNWTRFPEALECNRRFTDSPDLGPLSRLAIRHASTLARMREIADKAPIFRSAAGWASDRLRPTSQIPDICSPPPRGSNPALRIVYGNNYLLGPALIEPRDGVIVFEHGTLRWCALEDQGQAAYREDYRDLLERSPHVWVTNLDPATISAAESLVPGRWSALPHPYVPDPNLPFARDGDLRCDLLRRTRSDAAVFMPSSHNWSPGHDKGTPTALEAFRTMRSRGVEVGLVLVEWGLQVDATRRLVRDWGLDEHVVWLPPMPRIRLQRLMAAVDVVWDQFGYEAFGALAIRAMEQGAPLVSRGLSPDGAALIGAKEPWFAAASSEEIAAVSTDVVEHANAADGVWLHDVQTRYRQWFERHHSPAITAALQRDVYDRIAAGTWEAGMAEPAAWAKLTGDDSRPPLGSAPRPQPSEDA